MPEIKTQRSYYDSPGSTLLSKDYTPRDCDILCGRGRAWVHKGNASFKEMIESNLEKYSNSKRGARRSMLVKTLVDSFRQYGIFFVKFDSKLSRWYDVGDKEVHQKVTHAFRDALVSIKKKEKKEKRRKSMGHESAAEERLFSSMDPLVTFSMNNPEKMTDLKKSDCSNRSIFEASCCSGLPCDQLDPLPISHDINEMSNSIDSEVLLRILGGDEFGTTEIASPDISQSLTFPNFLNFEVMQSLIR